MNNNQTKNKPHWTQELETSPFKNPAFTQEMMNSVLTHSEKKLPAPRRKYKTIFRTTVAGVCTVALLVMIWTIRPALFKNNPIAEPPAVTGNWTPHSEYLTPEGTPKLQVLPGGEYQAGSPAGSWWNLYIPLKSIEGQNIYITATHKESGMQIEELAPTTITSDMAYNDFTRVSSAFSLPLHGLWKFEVFIEGDKFGDAVVDVPDSNWETSPLFQSGPYMMIGVENRLAFFHSELRAGYPNKYMWYFWGKDEELTGELHITAVKQNSVEIIDVFEAKLNPSKLSGADAAIPTTMTLPSKGLWRLMALIDGQLYGSVITEVK